MQSDNEKRQFSLQQVIDTIEDLSGLEVSIYPPVSKESPAIERLPISYRRHMSTFCRAVRNTRDGRGCGGHDSGMTNRLAADVGHPFVQVCHAGIAEVIVPVFGDGEHLATVFIGQAVTPDLETEGFAGVWRRVQERGVNRQKLETGFAKLPRMSRDRLLQIGMLMDAAIRGLTDLLSAEGFAREVRLQNAPAIRRAVDILEQERCWDISETEMADRVHLSPAHFCRTFHQVMDRTFKTHVTALRIRAAQTLLHQTDTPVGDIGQRCGFSRASYFARRFREVTGMSPTEYRNYRRITEGED